MYKNINKVIYYLKKEVKKRKVFVLGDLMLDKYCYGDVNRISPEAPIPVIKVLNEKNVLGGAGNVANNLKQLGCNVFLSGVIGKDENGTSLIKLLKEKIINYDGIVLTDRDTTTKNRIIGLHQQMLRIDRENTNWINHVDMEKIKRNFYERIKEKIDVIVISDYEKGVCTPDICRFIIAEANKNNIPILIDPKGKNWKKYEGADFIFPNIKEMSLVLNKKIGNSDKEIEVNVKKLLNQFNTKNIIVKRSEKGLSIINSNKAIHISAKVKEVFDVSGAGDTIISIFAAFLNGGLEYEEIGNLANLAAGYVISKEGTYAISNRELIDILNKEYSSFDYNKKIISTDNDVIDKLIKKLKKKNYKIVFTNGCFDIIHNGHVNYLRKAKQFGDILIVGINSDSSAKKIKGEKRPIINEEDRAKLIANFSFVDYILIFQETTPKRIISMIKPDVLVKGGDYNVEEIVGKDYAKMVKTVPYEKGYSTSQIIKEIIKRYKKDLNC
jgi:D-beta-D-heptose 7-phosphate kinase / D-beta-D-heptose 1-phosphate adenosyltransferase